MNKKSKIMLVLILFIIATVAVAFIVMNSSKNEEASSKLLVNSDKDLINIVKKLYDGKDLPKLDTNSIDVKDKDMVASYTGLKDGSDLEYLVVSEPLINAQAYSLVIAKVKDGKADSIAKQMSENVNMAKWICASAEKLYATSSGDLAILVMSSEEWAKPVYDAFKKEAGTVGKEYEKEEELPDFEDFMIEDDMINMINENYEPAEIITEDYDSEQIESEEENTVNLAQ